MSTNKLNYISNYNKENYKMYQFRVKKSETEIIEKLDAMNNRNTYINNLIVEDMNPGILTIKQIKEKIKPIMLKHGIKNVYLFGSYARGEANRDSDVDLYCDKGDVDTLWKSSSFRDELENALKKRVDVITIGSQMPEYFRKQLEEDMIKIC